MKIAFIASFVPRKCGIATYTRDLSLEIHKKRIPISIFAMQNPMIPAVSINGSKFGMMETSTILNERNIKPIKSAVKKKANASDESKLSRRYPVPF